MEIGIRLYVNRDVKPDIAHGLFLKTELEDALCVSGPFAQASAVATLDGRRTVTLGLDRAIVGLTLAGRILATMLAAWTPGALFRRRAMIADFGHAHQWAGQNPSDCQQYIRHAKHERTVDFMRLGLCGWVGTRL